MNSVSVSVQFILFTRLTAIINYYCISLCILGKLRFPSRPLISLLVSGLQQLWESRERGHRISFCWRDRGVDWLLGREINYNANSKRSTWKPGVCGGSNVFTQILFTQHFRSAGDEGVFKPWPGCMTAVISHLHLVLNMPLQYTGEISRFC